MYVKGRMCMWCFINTAYAYSAIQPYVEELAIKASDWRSLHSTNASPLLCVLACLGQMSCMHAGTHSIKP